MKHITEKARLCDGTVIRRAVDFHDLLNLHVLRLLNKVHTAGLHHLPIVPCYTDTYPDYLALYNQVGTYHKTPNTGVCFHVYDKHFDGQNGLFNAIYYNNRSQLDGFRKRFKGVKYFLSPDYSVFGNLHCFENIYRLAKARIVALWLIHELGAVVIPNMTYISKETFEEFFCGMEDCSTVSFSTKGHIRAPKERKLLQQAVRYVDNLSLKTIVVYSVCRNDETSLRLFQYATDHGIHLVLPQNSLRERNQIRGVCK